MVSRGTSRTRLLRLPTATVELFAKGGKTQHRFIVDRNNSRVRPGAFVGVDLETGRRGGCVEGFEGRPVYELRARHRFESGDVRAVKIVPAYTPGDLFAIVPGNGGFDRATHTAEVVGVDVARLQDMTDDDALAEGCVPTVEDIGPRALFAARWDKGKHARRWSGNPWVWVVRLARVD